MGGKTGPIAKAVRLCRPHFIAAACFSALINLLYLTPTLFMLQVYDRVVPTAGVATLWLLGLVALFAYATLGLLDWFRSRLLVKVSLRLDRTLARSVLDAVLQRPALSRVDRAEALRDFDAFRQSMSGSAVAAAFDVPWTPIYVVAAFLLNMWLGVATLMSGAILVLLAWSNERSTSARLIAANSTAATAYAKQAHMTDYAAEVRALGMSRALAAKTMVDRAESTALQHAASLAAGGHASLIKTVRLVLQSAALGLGAWLAINQMISAGAIIAASLLLSRALAPVEALVGSWKSIVRGRAARAKLDTILGDEADHPVTKLPRPTGRIDLEELVAATPQGDRVALAGISASIAPGEVLGLAGLSGAGKSTLLNILAGAARPVRGTARLDGASLADWNPDQLAEHVGFLPQEFILFSGTVKQNIARFGDMLGLSPAALDEGAVAAARLVGAHDMILRLPNGYDTVIGHNGVGLSAGQTQRVALARALFGNPAVVVLDEPSANLDAEAQAGLYEALKRLRQAHVTVVFSSHDPQLLGAADRIMLLAGGRVVRLAAVQPQGAAATPNVLHGEAA